MDGKVILLVGDNRRDEALILRALKKSNILHTVIVVRDGVEALDYLLSTATSAGGAANPGTGTGAPAPTALSTYPFQD